MTSNVFTYGSLMFDEVWSRVVEGRYRAVDGKLRDHARHAVDGQDYPGMVHRPGASVDGIVWCDVGAADLERLDRFEGADYRRDTVPVACSDGMTRLCGAYVYLSEERLADRPWLPEAFAMERFLATYCADWPAR